MTLRPPSCPSYLWAGLRGRLLGRRIILLTSILRPGADSIAACGWRMADGGLWRIEGNRASPDPSATCLRATHRQIRNINFIFETDLTFQKLWVARNKDNQPGQHGRDPREKENDEWVDQQTTDVAHFLEPFHNFSFPMNRRPFVTLRAGSSVENHNVNFNPSSGN